MIVYETNTNPPFHSPRAGLLQKLWQKPRAGLFKPLLIWKRDSDSCACSCFHNSEDGCSAPLIIYYGCGLWVLPAPLGAFPASLRENSPEPKRDTGFLSYSWEKVSVCQDHQTGRDREEQQEGERREGDRGLIFFPIFSPSSPAEPSHT